MGKIVLHNSVINDENVFRIINNCKEDALQSSKNLRAFAKYLSVFLLSKSEEITDMQGDSDVSMLYMDVAADLNVLFDLKSLQKFVVNNHDSVSQIYMREPVFRAFADKFLPGMMVGSGEIDIVKSNKASEPSIPLDKIVPFFVAKLAMEQDNISAIKTR